MLMPEKYNQQRMETEMMHNKELTSLESLSNNLQSEIDAHNHARETQDLFALYGEMLRDSDKFVSMRLDKTVDKLLGVL